MPSLKSLKIRYTTARTPSPEPLERVEHPGLDLVEAAVQRLQVTAIGGAALGAQRDDHRSASLEHRPLRLVHVVGVLNAKRRGHVPGAQTRAR